METNVSDTAKEPVSASHHFKPKMLLPFLLVIIVVAVVYVLFSKQQISNFSGPSKVTVVTVNPKRAMEQQVKAAFTSASDKNIIGFLNLASTEKDPAKAYADYQKAYGLMLVSYNKGDQSSQAAKKEAMSALKNYISTLTGYKESDFVTPK